ncbi:MAG: hypothetical protein ACFFAO_21720, partial [Candidatus Hermodarchaeota archaeon]
NLAELINHLQRIYNLCNLTLKEYKKMIFETDNISIIIIKLGEESNLALFFKKEEEHDLKLNPIRRYLTRIEELIDMDKIELEFQEIIIKEDELKNLQNNLSSKEIQINDLKNELDFKDKELYHLKTKNIEELQSECIKLREEIEQKKMEINKLKISIEQEKKKD